MPYSFYKTFYAPSSTANSYTIPPVFHFYHTVSHILSHRWPCAESARRDCQTSRTSSTIKFAPVVLHGETHSKAALRSHDQCAISERSGTGLSETLLLCWISQDPASHSLWMFLASTLLGIGSSKVTQLCALIERLCHSRPNRRVSGERQAPVSSSHSRRSQFSLALVARTNSLGLFVAGREMWSGTVPKIGVTCLECWHHSRFFVDFYWLSHPRTTFDHTIGAAHETLTVTFLSALDLQSEAT